MKELPKRRSPRAKWWDYKNPATYFVTICTQHRQHYFGHISEDKMQLSHAGIVAHILWHEMTNHFPDIMLGEFVVMPNHVHGIINLLESDVGRKLSLSTVIGAYKASVSRYCNKLVLPMVWQSRFFDMIIETEQQFNNVENYIINNPLLWNKDSLYSDNAKNR